MLKITVMYRHSKTPISLLAETLGIVDYKVGPRYHLHELELQVFRSFQLFATLAMVSKVISPASADAIFDTSLLMNLSIIPTICALPALSGCQIIGWRWVSMECETRVLQNIGVLTYMLP